VHLFFRLLSGVFISALLFLSTPVLIWITIVFFFSLFLINLLFQTHNPIKKTPFRPSSVIRLLPSAPAPTLSDGHVPPSSVLPTIHDGTAAAHRLSSLSAFVARSRVPLTLESLREEIDVLRNAILALVAHFQGSLRLFDSFIAPSDPRDDSPDLLPPPSLLPQSLQSSVTAESISPSVCEHFKGKTERQRSPFALFGYHRSPSLSPTSICTPPISPLVNARPPMSQLSAINSSPRHHRDGPLLSPTTVSLSWFDSDELVLESDLDSHFDVSSAIHPGSPVPVALPVEMNIAPVTCVDLSSLTSRLVSTFTSSDRYGFVRQFDSFRILLILSSC
jgi:hypothetical protein